MALWCGGFNVDSLPPTDLRSFAEVSLKIAGAGWLC